MVAHEREGRDLPGVDEGLGTLPRILPIRDVVDECHHLVESELVLLDHLSEEPKAQHVTVRPLIAVDDDADRRPRRILHWVTASGCPITRPVMTAVSKAPATPTTTSEDRSVLASIAAALSGAGVPVVGVAAPSEESGDEVGVTPEPSGRLVRDG